MKTYYALLLPGLIGLGAKHSLFARDSIQTNSAYRETPSRINNLIHTKPDVRFDYNKRYLYGKEWITLKPHFYPTDSLRLHNSVCFSTLHRKVE